jgi:hypothetical protein
MRESRDPVREDHAVSRAVLGSAIAAIAVLVLLMPATPLVGLVLMAANVLGVVAVLVRRAEDRRSSGATLERLSGRGYLVLRDRVSPGLTGTIGHLVIGPGGVFVIETRDESGRVRVRGDRLVVGDRSHEVGGQLRAQVAAVTDTLAPVLGDTRVTIVPLICMRRAELPLIGRTVAGIPMLRESQLEHRIATSAPVLDASTIARVTDLVEIAMPARPRRRLNVRPGQAGPGTDEVMVETTELVGQPPQPAGGSPALGLPANLALPRGRG